MKVMVTTKKGQGKRKNDFCWTNEGELAKFGLECDREEVDGHCGCRRSFCGFDTSKATTTATIEDRDITRAEFIGLMKKALEREGWYRPKETESGLSNQEIEEEADELLSTAKAFPVGAIIEKRGNKLQVRAK
jgi:hypothetical protein